MKETEKYISHRLTGSLRYCTTIHRRRQFSRKTFLQIEPIKCLQIIGPNLFTTQAQLSKMLAGMPRCRVGLGAWGSKLDFVIGQGWPPSSTSISNCALLPLVGPQPTLGMDSPMLETERQNLGPGGAGTARVESKVRQLRAVRLVPAPSALARPQSEWKWRLWGGRRSGDGDGVSNGNEGGR